MLVPHFTFKRVKIIIKVELKHKDLEKQQEGGFMRIFVENWRLQQECLNLVQFMI